MLTLLCIIVGAVIAQVLSSNHSYCNNLLSSDQLNPVWGWHIVDQCRLHVYGTDDVVRCFDVAQNKSKFHLIFVGDSRTRQQFYSFIKLLPNFDFYWRDFNKNQWDVHHDVVVDSDLLNVPLSFQWRPVLNDSVINQLKQWIASEEYPHVIIIGLGSHRMLPKYGKDHSLYEKRLIELVPSIKALSTKCQIIWLHQNPVLSAYVGEYTGAYSFFITQHLIENYNKVARRILRDSGALIWDSGALLAEEYSRGCGMINRQEGDKYHRCTDFIHIGYVAIDRTTQILINFLCNRRLASSLSPTVHVFPDT